VTGTPKLDWRNAMVRKAIVGFVVITTLPALIVFLAAGRIDWWQAWAMVCLNALVTILSRVILLRVHPDLVAERARWTEDRNTKEWDKRLMPIVALYGPWCMWLVAGLDKRWNASPPVIIELEIAAFVCIILGYAISTWAFLENKFFSTVVRIQTDRGHTVVCTGPYAWVRHPGYAGIIIGYILTPIALGTLWVLLPAGLTCVVLIIRTALEDKALQDELPGYADYAKRVRYRLMPGVW
jgi:protein-S-isoprenylcysteine O-methyltransferase Ste14